MKTGRFPAQSHSPATGPAGQPPPNRQTAEPASILVVDDGPREPGVLARPIRREAPGPVLLDLVLPATDGIALMTEGPELSDPTVIFIAGYGRDETIARALALTPTEYGLLRQVRGRRRAGGTQLLEEAPAQVKRSKRRRQ